MPKKKAKVVPVTIQDEILGQVSLRTRLSPVLDGYDARVDIEGNFVELDLYSDDTLDIAPAIRHARDIVKDCRKVLGNAREFFGKEVLPHYNDIWRQPGEPEAGKSLFEELTLITIVIHADGRATFVFDPGELLGDHLLWLITDSALRFVEYDTPG